MAFGDPGGPGGGRGGWGDPGGPSDGAMGGGNFGGMDGHGGFADSVATEGPGKGYGGGHSGGSSDAGRGMLGSELATEGAGKGYGGGHASPGAGTGSSGGTVRGQVRSERMGQQPAADFDTIATGAIASFEGQQRGFMSEVDAQSPRGLTQDMGPGLQEGDLDTVARDIQATAKPGLIGRGLTTLAGAVPGLGVAVDATARTFDATSRIGQLNDDFGADLDNSFSGNIGQQARGSLGGLLGGKLGGTAGGRVGAAVGGLPGAIAGTLGGAALGGSFGRNAGLGHYGGSTPGTGMGAGASTPASTPATMSPKATAAAPSVYGPVDFDGYASHAASFFG
ncbi:hypothetical protein ACGTNG_12505 [Halomonas sp. 1390]|uniref:hypothetical protein n=1 Tax=Halomonas sp. B23F22_3 TaxID=3459516 RepID=UPI00373F790B